MTMSFRNRIFLLRRHCSTGLRSVASSFSDAADHVVTPPPPPTSPSESLRLSAPSPSLYEDMSHPLRDDFRHADLDDVPEVPPSYLSLHPAYRQPEHRPHAAEPTSADPLCVDGRVCAQCNSERKSSLTKAKPWYRSSGSQWTRAPPRQHDHDRGKRESWMSMPGAEAGVAIYLI